MADDSATPTDPAPEGDAVDVDASKSTGDVPPEVKAALRKANKEAETLRLRLKEFEDRDKSEAEKQAERLKALEAEATTARAEALRLRVAAKHGIGDEQADLFLTGTDEATLTRQAQALAELASDRKRSGNHVPREGSPTPPGSSDERQLARELFSAG